MSDQNPFEERIVRAVQAFITAKTWPESKTIVQAHQDDLLTPAAGQVFEGLLMQYKDDEKARGLLEDHRSLLFRCRSEGIDAAFADRIQTRPTPDIPPELLDRLTAIRSEEELRELIKEHPELLPVIRQMTIQSQAPQESSTGVSSPGNLSGLLQEIQGLKRPSDMPRRVELCQAALRLVDRNAEPELWAGLHVEFGNSLYQNPLGDRAENLDFAIDHYNQALEVRTREAFPEDWAMTKTTWRSPIVTASGAIAPRTWTLRSTTTTRPWKSGPSNVFLLTGGRRSATWATCVLPSRAGRRHCGRL